MKKLLIYNNFSFHHDLIGFALEYCMDNNYIANVYNPNDYDNYMDFYKKIGLNFILIDKIINPKIYDLIIVLTDSDFSYTSENITNKTITLRHWYNIRNPLFKIQIPIAPFTNINNTYDPYFICPVYNLINKDQKCKISMITEIKITIIGRFIPDNIEYFNFINSDSKNVIYNIITQCPHDKLRNSKNVNYFENVNASIFYEILVNSHYCLITDLCYNHNNGFTISSSIITSFITGCQLIIPEEMNKHLRLKSAILYNKNKKIILDNPNYDLVFNERQDFIDKRNNILNAIINY